MSYVLNSASLLYLPVSITFLFKQLQTPGGANSTHSAMKIL